MGVGDINYFKPQYLRILMYCAFMRPWYRFISKCLVGHHLTH